MKFQFLALLISTLIMACNTATDTPADDMEGPSSETAVQADPTDTPQSSGDERLDKVKEIVAIQPGVNLVKLVELDDDVATVEYSNAFSGNNKTISPDEYWSTGNRMDKLMTDLPLQIMRQTGYVNRVKISIPYKGKMYHADVSQDELMKFLGRSYKDVVNNLEEFYYIPYVNSKKGRDRYVKEFVHIK